LRSLGELHCLFQRLASFSHPLVVLASQISPRIATAAPCQARNGVLKGHVLWVAPLEEGTPDPLEALGKPVEELSQAMCLDPETLPMAEHLLWLDGGALLETGESGRTFAVLSLGPGVRRSANLRRTLSLVDAARHHGMLSGGGAAYLALARTARLHEVPLLPFKRCLEAPLRAVLDNENMDADTVLDHLRSLPPGAGFDVLERRYFHSGEEGPATPAPVVEAVVRGAFDAALASLAEGGGHDQGS
jgi:hypothetical protein